MSISLPHDQRSVAHPLLPLATTVALFAVYLFSYSGQFHSIDENAVFAVARNLVEYGRVDIGSLFWGPPYFDQGRLGPDGELYSKYGLGHSLLLAPAVWLGLHLPGAGVVQTAVLLDGLATAATGGCLVVLARRLGFARAGPWLAGLYGLGTFAWVYARTLFGEPIAALLFAATLAVAPWAGEHGPRGGPKPDEARVWLRRWWIAGALLGLNILVRPVNVLFAPLFALLLPWSVGRRQALLRPALALAAPAALGVAGALWYNWFRFRHPLIFGYTEGFHQPMLAGLTAFLFSLDRSLFLYAPPLILVPLTLRRVWRRSRPVALVCLGLGASTLAVYSRWDAFWGGPVWGPRYLLPALPLLCLLLAPAAEAAGSGARRWQIALGLTGVAGALVNAGGLFFDRYAYLQQFGQRYPLLLRPPRLIESDWAWVQPGPGGLRITWLPLALAGSLLVAALASGASTRRRTALALAGFTVAASVVSLREATAIGFGFTPRPGYRETAQIVAAEGRPGDVLVLSVAPQDDFGQTLSWFANNYKGPVPVAGLFRRAPLDEPAGARLAFLANHYRRVWVLTEQVPPGDPASTAEAWLSRHAFPLDDRWLGLARLSRFVNEASGLVAGGPERLEGDLTLARWLAPQRITSGGFVPVELTWLAAERQPARLRVFVQILTPEGALVAGRDQEPQNGYAPTTEWAPGAPVVDRHALPAPATPGRYRLVAGLYDPEKGTRLATPAGGEFVELGTLDVEPRESLPARAGTV